MILLDTSVLSRVFRRKRPSGDDARIADRFRGLVEDELNLGIPGIVFQEILSGVREEPQVRRLERSLSAFPIVVADRDDHLEAARLINRLRRQGIASATVDALIAATAIRREAVLFAIDDDFLPFIEYGGLRMLDS